jgi:hypothetical protein
LWASDACSWRDIIELEEFREQNIYVFNILCCDWASCQWQKARGTARGVEMLKKHKLPSEEAFEFGLHTPTEGRQGRNIVSCKLNIHGMKKDVRNL